MVTSNPKNLSGLKQERFVSHLCCISVKDWWGLGCAESVPSQPHSRIQTNGVSEIWTGNCHFQCISLDSSQVLRGSSKFQTSQGRGGTCWWIVGLLTIVWPHWFMKIWEDQMFSIDCMHLRVGKASRLYEEIGLEDRFWAKSRDWQKQEELEDWTETGKWIKITPLASQHTRLAWYQLLS